jgi:hypothetical protein
MVVTVFVLSIPGFVELSLCSLWVTFWILCAIRDVWPWVWSYLTLLIATPVSIAFGVAAIRARRDPVFSRLHGSACAFWTGLILASRFVFDPNSEIGRIIPSLWFLVGLCFSIGWGFVGQRNRHRAIPGLIRALKSRKKHVRRMAACTLRGMARLDPRLHRNRPENRLVRWLRCWLHPCGITYQVTAEAIPALRDALRDDDDVVRFVAAKALDEIAQGVPPTEGPTSAGGTVGLSSRACG